MHPRHRLILSLTSLAALGPLAFDAFLPALPALGKEFGMSLPATQSLLAVYLAARASSHLLSAWAANAFGKQSVLIMGTLLLCAGSAVCALASEPWQLQSGRILQGLGAGAAAALLPLLLRAHSSLAVRLRNRNRAATRCANGSMVIAGCVMMPAFIWRYSSSR